MISLLYDKEKNYTTYNENNPLFKDLNLDDVIREIRSFAKSFDIKDYFYNTLNDVNDILYRQEIFKDLENQELFDALNLFSYTMHNRITSIEEKNDAKYTVLKQIRLKQRISEYLDILQTLKNNLERIGYNSLGIKKLYEMISSYLDGDKVQFIRKDMAIIDEEMSKIKFRLGLDNGAIKIAKYEEKSLIEDDIFNVLDKYKVDDPIDYTRGYGKPAEYISAQIYTNLSKYYPDEFKHLELYSKHFSDFIDENIKEIVNEIQFYSAYILYIKSISDINIPFSYPSYDKDSIYCTDGYDLALVVSNKLKGIKTIPNSFLYENKERVLVISGPNQGGKTTFSRYVGQTFYLGMLGVLVSGTSSSLKIMSNIMTMYEVEEDSSNLNGKLKSELIRIKGVMDNIGEGGLLIMNEVFSSTSLYDGIILGKKVIDMLNSKNGYGVFVTFIEELSSYNETTVSMGSTVLKDDPSVRTFEILRRLDNTEAYAQSIATKNKVSYDDIIRSIE